MIGWVRQAITKTASIRERPVRIEYDIGWCDALTSLRGRLEEVERPEIVCLCGSTRFMQAFFDAGWKFTLEGIIVLSVGVCKHVDTEGGHGAEMLGQDVADALDELHLRKIDLADSVFVLNVGGYIGESTAKEIAYAEKMGKSIRYLEPRVPNNQSTIINNQSDGVAG